MADGRNERKGDVVTCRKRPVAQPHAVDQHKSDGASRGRVVPPVFLEPLLEPAQNCLRRCLNPRSPMLRAQPPLHATPGLKALPWRSLSVQRLVGVVYAPESHALKRQSSGRKANTLPIPADS